MSCEHTLINCLITRWHLWLRRHSCWLLRKTKHVLSICRSQSNTCLTLIVDCQLQLTLLMNQGVGIGNGWTDPLSVVIPLPHVGGEVSSPLRWCRVGGVAPRHRKQRNHEQNVAGAIVQLSFPRSWVHRQCCRRRGQKARGRGIFILSLIFM